jgi:hypothetical protein
MEEATETAYKDQLDAAAKDAEGVLDEISENVENEEGVEVGDFGELPPEVVWSSFIGSRFLWVDEPKLMKRLTYCNHSSLRAPGIFVVSAGRPNHVDCLQCGARRRDRALKAPHIPCDLCDKKDLVDGFHEIIMQAGNFILTALLCSDCQSEQDRSVEILTEQYNELAKEQEDAQDS